MLQHFLLYITLITFTHNPNAQNRCFLKDKYASSVEYFEALSVKLEKTVDLEKSKGSVSGYLKEKFAPYMTYEMTYFDAHFAAKRSSDTTLSYFAQERYVFVECIANILINEFITYQMHVLLDSNYQVLFRPEIVEEYGVQAIGKIKKFEALQLEVKAIEGGFVNPIASYQLFYDYENLAYYYKVESEPNRKKYNKRKVMGKYWKRYEVKNRFLIINAVDGELIEKGTEMQTVDINGPY